MTGEPTPREQRDALLNAAARDLFTAALESSEYVLPPEAARPLAEMLLWVTGRDVTPLTVSAVMLAEVLTLDPSERMTTAAERDAADARFHGVSP